MGKHYQKIVFMIIFTTIFLTPAFSQGPGIITSALHLPEELNISGYVDAYISYDNDKGESLRKYSLISAYRDEFKLNIAQLSVKYNSEIVSGVVTVHFGDIPALSWPTKLQFLQEANFGFRVMNKFWIDAGYFLTHLGAESIIPKYDDFSLMSLCGYFEPNYQSGVRLSYDFSDRLSAQVHFVNGYNVLEDNNKNKSAGIQIDYKPNDRLEFLYNNLLGNEISSSENKSNLRFYNNFITKYSPINKLDLMLCVDYCTQTRSKIDDPESSASMLSGFITIRYQVLKEVSLAVRGETYQDKNGILSGIVTSASESVSGLRANGLAFSLRYDPVKNAYVRIETRYLKTQEDIRIFSSGNHTSRTEVSLSSGIEF